jgi:hypothetical protein
MTKHKTAAWLSGIAGLLALTAGLSNIFAPGFLSFSPQPMDNMSTVLGIVGGVIFLALAVSHAVKARGERGAPRA